MRQILPNKRYYSYPNNPAPVRIEKNMKNTFKKGPIDQSRQNSSQRSNISLNSRIRVGDKDMEMAMHNRSTLCPLFVDIISICLFDTVLNLETLQATMEYCYKRK